MDIERFSKISESLRQYRRAELKDFETDIGSKPVDMLYVDPLPGGAVLQTVLSSNTTFLLGRKGTGKSTVFAKAQSVLRERKNVISIYIDVKSIYDVLGATNIPDAEPDTAGISSLTYKAHMLRKVMLGKIISELLKGISDSCESLTLLEKWRGAKKQYDELRNSLMDIGDRVKNSKLEKHEIPVLQKITSQLRLKKQQEASTATSSNGKANAKIKSFDYEISGELTGSLSDFDRTLDDSDIYNEYSDVILKSFPFDDIITEIQTLISESGLLRLVAFFDDFSELSIVDQRLFVDVVLSPLNNSSNEIVKLKIAGYPGRIYHGKIDPSKADTVFLDFSDLYEANEVQEMERSASDYAYRLLETRFKVFGIKLEDYFDVTSTTLIEDYMSMMFRASFNVPRIMGHILHICYLDKISRNEKITLASIRLAAKKYYENTISRYFDRLNRYALEPFENKLDRNNQQQLLNCIVNECRGVRKRIIDKEVGGRYFDNLGGNPQTSHFIVSPDLEEIFSSLESNFFLSRYKNTRDKAGKNVVVYALFMGLCESERMNWGYPEGREYRNYFVQRCFEYTRAIHHFLSQNQTIKCEKCGFCHSMENRKSIELFKWRCPECMEGLCSIVNLSDDFREEVEKLDKDIMLEPIELEIVTTLNDEERKMRAGEISSLIDTTHQMVGKRTSKLQEMGLVAKERDETDGKMRNSLTDRCQETYFD
ncbi:regulatory protein MarR [Kiloniella spongiae]|uniref:Regulatory protein MarR n=2 Tax=Kiloniella spongiae TaxID=1489064 RepID=A0A0H2MFW1_9PROT|nr:regulatory protein MarR [Kiloniella spongiae]